MLPLSYARLKLGSSLIGILRKVVSSLCNYPPIALPEALITLDEEKAVNKVDWGHLFFTLGRKKIVSGVGL